MSKVLPLEVFRNLLGVQLEKNSSTHLEYRNKARSGMFPRSEAQRHIYHCHVRRGEEKRDNTDRVTDVQKNWLGDIQPKEAA